MCSRQLITIRREVWRNGSLDMELSDAHRAGDSIPDPLHNKNMTSDQKKNTILQKCWIWGDSVKDFVSSYVKGYSLNVCAGKNPICDVNLDLDPQDRSIIKGDMRLLQFNAETFDTVVSDPPWKIPYYERFKPFFECVRVCKIGGRIIYNATWIPSSTDVELEDIFVRQDGNFTNASLICVFRKVKANPEYEEKQRAELDQQRLITKTDKVTKNRILDNCGNFRNHNRNNPI